MTIIAQGATWAEYSIPLLLLGLFGIGAIVVIWQAFAVWRARTATVQGDAYRKLVEQLQADQQRTADALTALTTDVAHVRARTDELERILRTVDQ